jgi:NAD(P)-dependent dehydrogenase (short-subunit alcohol dehydrogenase family)
MAWMQTLNPPLREWRGQSVWIVGASSGIGRATASALHAQGALVTVSARNAQALQDFVREHPGSSAQVLDSSDAQAVAQVAQQCWPGSAPDMLLYCAGHYQPMRAQAMDVDEMRRHWEINYQGALHAVHAVLPAMRTRGTGHISLVASVAGYRGLPNSLAYGPTKAAMINLAENLYLDLQTDGVAVSVVNPGFVQTPLTDKNSFSMPALITPAQAAAAMLRGWAQGRFEIHYPRRFTLWMKLLRSLPNRWYFYLVRKATL